MNRVAEDAGEIRFALRLPVGAPGAATSGFSIAAKPKVIAQKRLQIRAQRGPFTIYTKFHESRSKLTATGSAPDAILASRKQIGQF